MTESKSLKINVPLSIFLVCVIWIQIISISAKKIALLVITVEIFIRFGSLLNIN